VFGEVGEAELHDLPVGGDSRYLFRHFCGQGQTAVSELEHLDVVRPLVEGELIDDRALESREEDAFRLSDVADELLGICRQAPTPATVALYASWGSGKSSLGRILEAEFEHDREIAYTRFDALKIRGDTSSAALPIPGGEWLRRR
jgi:hypothetical protein